MDTATTLPLEDQLPAKNWEEISHKYNGWLKYSHDLNHESRRQTGASLSVPLRAISFEIS